MLGELSNVESIESLALGSSQRSVANGEKVEARERDQVHVHLAKIAVQLTRETETSGDTRHNLRHQVVEVIITGLADLQRVLADVVKSIVIEANNTVGVFNQLVNRQGRIVRLNNGSRDLGRGHDGEGGEHAIRIFLTELGKKESSHTGTSTTTERVGQLESLELLASLSLTTDDFENRVDQLSTLSEVALGPGVTGTILTENKVVGTEHLANSTVLSGGSSARFEVDHDRARDITTIVNVREIHVSALELLLVVA